MWLCRPVVAWSRGGIAAAYAPTSVTMALRGASTSVALSISSPHSGQETRTATRVRFASNSEERSCSSQTGTMPSTTKIRSSS